MFCNALRCKCRDRNKVASQLETARAHCETMKKNLNKAQSQLEKARAQLKTARAQLKTARAQLKTVRAELKKAQAQFAVDILRVASDGDKNCFLSPVSISVALAMTYIGAANSTKLQMNQVMFNGVNNDEEIHHSFAELVNKLSEVDDLYALATANRVYAQKGQPLLPNFVDTLSKYYRSTLRSVDFITEANSAMKEINQWVEEMTKERIKDLLSPGVLTPDTRLVLVNAIYFKGAWVEQFKERDTRKATFYTQSNKEREVDMMRMEEVLMYSDQPDCQMLGMDYIYSDLAMYIFLPKKRDGLKELESNLTGSRMLQLINEDNKHYIEVHLPKFKLEMSFRLDDALSSLGMSDLFDPGKADFSNITGDRSLYVSAVVHKAFIEVNEKGTEATASTAVVMCLMSCGIPGAPPPKFVADHPFLFAISDGENLLFLGRYTGDE